MTHEPSPESAESTRRESDRLRDCSHLVGLLADQLEALEKGDYPRLRELESMRERLAAEMREEHGPDTPLLDWMGELIGDSLVRVEGWIETDRLSREEVAQLQDGSLPLIRGIDRRSGSGHYRSLDPGSARLDVRL